MSCWTSTDSQAPEGALPRVPLRGIRGFAVFWLRPRSPPLAPFRAPSILLVLHLVRDRRELHDRGGDAHLADLRAGEGRQDGLDEGVGLDGGAFGGAGLFLLLDQGLAAAGAVGGDQPGAAGPSLRP